MNKNYNTFLINAQLLLGIAITTVGLMAGAPSTVRADQEVIGCSTERTLDKGVTLLPQPGVYDILVRYKNGGDSERSVRLAQRLNDKSCVLLPQTRADATWRQAGTVTISSTAERLSLYGGATNEQQYGFTELLVLPKTAAVKCLGREACLTTGQEVDQALQPALAFNRDYTLSASLFVSPDKDTVQWVETYNRTLFIGGRPVVLFNQQTNPQQQRVYYGSGQIGQINQQGGKVTSQNQLVHIVANSWSVIVICLLLAGLLTCFVVMLPRWLQHRRFRRYRDIYLADSYWRRESKQRFRQAVALGVVGLGFLIITVAAGRMYVVDIATIDGSSMEPDVSDGGRVLIDKVPLTLARLTDTEPQLKRGQKVFIQKSIYDNLSRGDRYIFKRVVGLPGDTIYFSSEVMSVKNTAGQTVFSDSIMPVGTLLPMEYQPQQFTVPAGSVYVLGDNRPASIDSRVFGSVPLRFVIGTAR